MPLSKAIRPWTMGAHELRVNGVGLKQLDEFCLPFSALAYALWGSKHANPHEHQLAGHMSRVPRPQQLSEAVVRGLINH